MARQGRTAGGRPASVRNLVFGKKRFFVADAVEASEWQVSEREYEGSRLIARVNAAYRRAADQAEYAIRVGVAIPLNDPDESGLPQGTELEQLNAIEDTLVESAGLHAALTCVLTTSAMREFVFHSRTSEWIEPFHRQMDEVIAEHEVQVMALRDPEWTFYRQIVGE